MPSTCIDSDMESISSALSSSLKLNITIPDCRVKQLQSLTAQQLIGGLVFGLVVAIVISATLMDISSRKLQALERRDIALLSVSTTEVAGGKSIDSHPDKVSSTAIESSFIIHRSRLDKDEVVTDDKEDCESESSHSNRLATHWSWMSFSLLINYKLYFTNFISYCAKPMSRRNREEFSAVSNQITNSNNDSVSGSRISLERSNQFKCLNGIRVLSLCWVILANSYITLDPRATKRLTKTREAPKDFMFQMIAQASLAIETFFFLSGLLMSMSFSRQLGSLSSNLYEVGGNRREQSDSSSHGGHADHDGRWKKISSSERILRWVRFYVHRYVRMTPATMLIIALTMFTYHFGDGPLWFEATHKAHQSCGQNWWRHLLHVANFIDTRQMCFIHYWYISADMQLFLLAPLLMVLLHHRRRIGYLLVSLVGFASVASVFYTTYTRNLPPTLLFYNSDPESRREFGNTIMTKPLTHALPYMVGMLVGTSLTAKVATNDRQFKPSIFNLDRRGIATTWIGLIALLVALAEVFLPYRWNNQQLPTRFVSAIYAALFRFGWSLVLAYLVLSCRHRRCRSCNSDDRGERVKELDINSIGETKSIRCESCKHMSMAADSLRSQHDTNVIDTSISGKRTTRDASNCSHQESLNMTTGGPDSSDYEVTTTWWCLCESGGSLLNRMLGLNIFTHLSKLAFVAYLIHLPLMSMFVAQTRGLFAFSHTLVIHLALSYMVMTFFLSFILVHIIEFPFITFEKYFFQQLAEFIQKYHSRRNAKTCDDHRNGLDNIDGQNPEVFGKYSSTISSSSYKKSLDMTLTSYRKHNNCERNSRPDKLDKS